MKHIKTLIIIAVCALCAGALVYFIFFFGGAKNDNATVTTSPQKSYEITFDTDTLHYTIGTDLMSGVKATDENGKELTDEVTVSCKPTNNIAVKELSYSINQAGYEIKSYNRRLVIDDAYEGPSIEVLEGNIEIPLNEIENMSQNVSKSGLVVTDDGFGRSCSITAVPSAKIDTAGDYVITITAENMFGDTKSTKLGITVTEATSSIIKLTTSSITLNIGDKFLPQNYIKSAVSKDYGDVTGAVVCTTVVDTSKAGRYVAEYKINGISELKNEVAKLYITVK